MGHGSSQVGHISRGNFDLYQIANLGYLVFQRKNFESRQIFDKVISYEAQ